MLLLLKEWLPLSVSFGALVVSLVFGWATQSDRRSTARLAREKDLHDWVKEIGAIYADLLGGDEIIQAKAATRLSIQIDYGRLLFPNETTPQALQEYPIGRRSSVLDPLVESHRRSQSKHQQDLNKLSEDWREFTNQLGLRTTAFAITTSPESQGKQQYRNP